MLPLSTEALQESFRDHFPLTEQDDIWTPQWGKTSASRTYKHLSGHRQICCCERVGPIHGRSATSMVFVAWANALLPEVSSGYFAIVIICSFTSLLATIVLSSCVRLVCWGSAVEDPPTPHKSCFHLCCGYSLVIYGLLVNPMYFTCLPFFQRPFCLRKYA